tara:strand:+ start:1117 stop:2343 length:1227 start_codon:yes stop_codon:yes gene_type:complete
MRGEFNTIEDGFDKLPSLTADYVIKVNAGGTALEAVVTLAVAQGGTGVATLTDGGILLGSGTGAITATAVLADGEMIVGDGTTDPAIESGATLRTSIGCGATDTLQIRGLLCDGVIDQNDDTESTSTITGSIHTEGGLGVVKNVHINGNLVTTGPLYSTRLGINAGTNFDSNDFSTAFGYTACELATGTSIVGVGHGAMKNATTGNNTTAIGSSALASLVGGHGNTGVGRSCYSDLTSGNNNTCIGFLTQTGDNSAQHRICIGQAAETDQDYQVAIGTAANQIKNEFDTDATWSQASDLRKKNVIGPIVLGLKFINDLKPILYTIKPMEEWPEEWGAIAGDINTKRVIHGLGAQDVLQAIKDSGVDPATFSGWSEDKHGQRISKEAMVIPLIKAVQELTARIEELENN